jgi:hypothetical protein
MVAFLQPLFSQWRGIEEVLQLARLAEILGCRKSGRPGLAEVLVQFTEPIVAAGVAYRAEACGAPTSDGLWQGWIEFTPTSGGSSVRSRRETTQPNRVDAVYWATGLTPIYLEGALQRTLRPRLPVTRPPEPVAAFDSPAADAIDQAALPEAILDPFSVYRKGEELLRRQLSALSGWHVVNIIRAYRLSDLTPPELNALTRAALIEIVVDGVRASVLTPHS